MENCISLSPAEMLYAPGGSEVRSMRSQALDLLRFPLAIVVAAVHICCTSLLLYENFGDTFAIEKTGAVRYMASAIYLVLSNNSVPIYYFIAGYVFFLGTTISRDVYIRKIRNRARSLLMPYLAWNLLMIALLQWPAGLQAVAPTLAQKESQWSIGGFLELFWNISESIYPIPQRGGIYPVDIPLWFVRNLMVLALCSPLLQWLFRHCAKPLLLLAFTVWIASHMLGYDTLWQSSMSLFFFSWGGYLSYRGRDMAEEFRRLRRTSFILFPTLCVLYVATTHLYVNAAIVVKDMNTIVGLFAAYNFAFLALERRWLRMSRFLSSASFFIYAGHALVYGLIAKLLALVFTPADDTQGACFLLLVLLLTVGSLLGVYWCMRRWTPRVLAVFTGGRI